MVLNPGPAPPARYPPPLNQSAKGDIPIVRNQGTFLLCVDRRRAGRPSYGRTCEQLVSRQVSGPRATRAFAHRGSALPRLRPPPRRRSDNGDPGKIMNWPIATLSLRSDDDVVAAWRVAREIAGAMNFDLQDQTRIATSVSEISRNAVSYAGGGQIDFALDGDAHPQILWVTVRDKGPGIPDLDAVYEGRFPSVARHGQRNCRRAPAYGRVFD